MGWAPARQHPCGFWGGELFFFLGNSLLEEGLQPGFQVTSLISHVLRDSVI